MILSHSSSVPYLSTPYSLFEQISKRALEVMHKDSGTTTRFTAPVSSYSVTPKHSPVSLDLSSSSALGAVSDGNFKNRAFMLAH